MPEEINFKEMMLESQKQMATILASQQELNRVMAENAGLTTKHTLANSSMTVEEGLNERAFFQDCALDSSILNFTLQPVHSLVNTIPARGNVYRDRKFGMMTGMGSSITGPRPVNVCDPGQLVSATYEFCKMAFPFSRFDLRIGTFEIDQLIQEVCEYLYDHFYFVGDVRGVSSPPNRNLDPLNDRGLITEGAIMRSFAEMARVFQIHMANQTWIGNPANNTGEGYKEHLGLEHFFDDDIPNNVVLSPYLESGSGNLADCAAMNADVKVFDSCIGDINASGYNIWQLLQEAMDTLIQRARAMSYNPNNIDWRIVMPSTTFVELAKVLPCFVSADGCVSFGQDAGVLANAPKQGTVSLTTMLNERERLLDSQTIRMWGRDFPVLFDDFMPMTVNGTEITSDIYIIPYSIGGEPLLWYEYMDYSRWEQLLRPIPGSITNAMGWTDGGRYHLIIEQVMRCFEVDAKTETRLIFRGTPLSAKITGVRSCPIQEKPLVDIIQAPDHNL